MAMLFCLAGVFTSLGAFFPEKNVEAIGTIVFGYILGFCICISDDIMAGLTPLSLTALVAIKCYDSFEVFMGYIWYMVPLVGFILFHLIVYRKN